MPLCRLFIYCCLYKIGDGFCVILCFKKITDCVTCIVYGKHLFVLRCTGFKNMFSHIIRYISVIVAVNYKYWDVCFLHGFFRRSLAEIYSGKQPCRKSYKRVNNPVINMSVACNLAYDFFGGRLWAVGNYKFDVFGNI